MAFAILARIRVLARLTAVITSRPVQSGFLAVMAFAILARIRDLARLIAVITSRQFNRVFCGISRAMLARIGTCEFDCGSCWPVSISHDGLFAFAPGLLTGWLPLRKVLLAAFMACRRCLTAAALPVA